MADTKNPKDTETPDPQLNDSDRKNRKTRHDI